MDDELSPAELDENPFLRMFAEAKPETKAEEPGEEADEAPEGDADEATEEGEEGVEAVEKLADDDHLVVVKTGDTERKVSIKDLKELLGREESIKTRDTETQAAQKRVSEESDRHIAVMGELVKQADAKLKVYQDLDWHTARQKLGDAAFQQLRADAQEAANHARFVRESGNAFVQQVQQNRATQHQESLKACDEAVAKDPDMKGVSRADLKAYAAKLGADASVVDNMVLPWALKAIHKAMLYDKGAEKVAAAVKNPAKTSTKTTLKAGTLDGKSTQSAEASALAKLRKSGSSDDAEAYFLARFGG